MIKQISTVLVTLAAMGLVMQPYLEVQATDYPTGYVCRVSLNPNSNNTDQVTETPKAGSQTECSCTGKIRSLNGFNKCVECYWPSYCTAACNELIEIPVGQSWDVACQVSNAEFVECVSAIVLLSVGAGAVCLTGVIIGAGATITITGGTVVIVGLAFSVELAALIIGCVSAGGGAAAYLGFTNPCCWNYPVAIGEPTDLPGVNWSCL